MWHDLRYGCITALGISKKCDGVFVVQIMGIAKQQLQEKRNLFGKNRGKEATLLQSFYFKEISNNCFCSSCIKNYLLVKVGK